MPVPEIIKDMGLADQWERCVLKLKKHGDIETPWALCTWMLKEGYRFRSDGAVLRSDETVVNDSNIDEAIATAKANGGDGQAFVCPCCERECPHFTCMHCGHPCAPAFCPTCGMGLRPQHMPCLACGSSDLPMMEERMEMRSFVVSMMEARDFPDKGELLGWASSEIKDAHGTVIAPAEVLKHLASRTVKVDQEHDFRPIPGVSIVEVHPAKRPFKGDDGQERTIEGVSFTVRCDLAVQAARDLYTKFKDGAYKGFSIAFRIADDLKQRIAAGTTEIIDSIIDIPFVSAVREPSNGAALLLEMRNRIDKTMAGQKVEQEQQTKEAAKMDRLDLLRQDVAALREDAAPPSASSEEPAPPTSSDGDKPSDAGTMEARIADLASRVEAVIKTVEEMRTAATTKPWEPDVASCRSDMIALAGSVTEQTKRLESLIEVVRGLVPEMRRYVQSRIDALKAPERRKGIDPAAAALDAQLARMESRPKREIDHLTHAEELLHGL